MGEHKGTVGTEGERKVRSLGLIISTIYIQKTKIMASGPITSWEIDGEAVETVSDYFCGLKNQCRW